MLEGDTDLSGRVIDAAFAVQRALGAGFLEGTYQRALSIELRHATLRHEVEVPVALTYRGESVGDGRVDLLVEGRLVVELKAVTTLNDAHKTQVLAYLKATGLSTGLLINFHASPLRDGIRRVVN